MRFRCRILFWNINGKVTDRISIPLHLLQSHDLVLIQEHFLSEDRQSLLPLFSNFNLRFRSAIVRPRGWPSGGLAFLSRFPCNLLAETDYFIFIAAKLENHVVINVYLPTNYNSEQSDSRFASACKLLGSFLKIVTSKPVIISGDFM